MRKILYIGVVASLAAVAAGAQELPAYLDRSLEPEVRAADAVGRLSLEEKVQLMMFESPAIERLGIRQYNWWNEALHGVARNGEATVYPMPIGMAASFDDELLYEVFTSVSDEARVKNRIAVASGDGPYNYQGLTFWTPNINIFRDPRWGRGMETYGEDPYLTSVMGDAVVRGLQGDDPEHNLKTQACAKHFAVHSGPESGRHRDNVDVSDRDLYETYLPAFKHLVTESKVGEVMYAYNRFQGKPCGANTRLLQEILRQEWGFDGIIVTDCWAINDFYLPYGHHYSANGVEATAASVNAGANIECGVAFNKIPAAIEQGLLNEDILTESLIRIIATRIRLGEFDGESPFDDIPETSLCSEEHRLQSLQMARESMVLLLNKDNTLPLSQDTKILLVGPNAADTTMMWGNYNGIPTHSVTLLDAMRARVPGLAYCKGCEHALPGKGAETLEAEALAAAADCDIVIFAGGISPTLEGEDLKVEVPGFYGGDRTSLELPQIQRDLIRKFHELGKQVILVNFSGSAMALVPESESCDAILQAWYPGQEGGTAVADILFGDYNPGGKLPVTFYRSVDQLPDFSNYDMAGHTYRFFDGEPLFAFGYGLSYTTVKYGKARIRRNRVIVRVRNTGKRNGDEVVQLYVRRPDDPNGPAKTLRAFHRVSIPAGKSRRVVITLNDATFNWWSEDSGRVTPLAGSYELLVGSSSAASDLQTLRYTYRKHIN